VAANVAIILNACHEFAASDEHKRDAVAICAKRRKTRRILKRAQIVRAVTPYAAAT